MQKKLFLLVLLGVSLSLKAQFSVGVRGGYGAYGAYFEHPSMNTYQVPYYKFNGGLAIIYNNNNNAGLQTEINYTQKGWYEVDSVRENAYFYRNINYLEIPFYSHWELGYGKVRPIIYAGPYLAQKLNESRDSSNFDRIWYPDHRYKHYEQDIRDIDFGIKVGLGLRYNITPRIGIYIDFRYDLQMAGGRDIFIDHPNGIQASRLTEISGSFGILWHIIPQTKKTIVEGYKPKENLFEDL